jgi:hypothetical protein
MAKSKGKKMSGPIQNLLLTKKVAADRPVLSQINEMVDLMPGMDPKSVLRNFLLRYLPVENNRLRNNGGQPAGGSAA